jgi:hypothetical protein
MTHVFLAKKENGAIWIFAVGKWRPIIFHKYGNQKPSKKFLDKEVFPRLKRNLGAKEDYSIDLKWIEKSETPLGE